MKLWALDLLRCPKSGSILKLRSCRFSGEEIIEGELLSEEGLSYPIVNGIPRLILDSQDKSEKRTVEAFGNEWAIFNKCSGYLGSKALFFDFVRGLSEYDFKDKVVLDAGCGNGRWEIIMSQLGCKYIVAMDLSESVDCCFKNTADCKNVVVVQGSIYNPPLAKEKFDLIVSIGVIDHLVDPEKGLNFLKPLLIKNGRLAFWVYALEGNELYLKFLKPLRAVSTKIPKEMLFIISRLLSVPVWFYTHTINKNLGLKRDGSMRLPLARYFSFLSKFTYSDIVNIVYDQLTPELAHYIPKNQLRNWLKESKLDIEKFDFRNSNSYSVLTKLTR